MYSARRAVGNGKKTIVNKRKPLVYKNGRDALSR
jgi:hypothetical protein